MNNLKLKSKRIEKGLTQKELAKKIGIVEVSYNRKELGSREFTCSEISKLAIALSLTNDELIEIFFA